MGLFDQWKNPFEELGTQIQKGLDEAWDTVEGYSQSVNPGLGHVVKTVGNAGKAVQNFDAKKHVDKVWRDIEDGASDTNPELGEAVKHVGNVGKTAQNFLDSTVVQILAGGTASVVAHRVPTTLGYLSARQKPDKPVRREDLRTGDHLWFDCFAFSHHGVYIGSGRVIHYGKSEVRDDPSICCVTLEKFAEGNVLYRKDSLATHSSGAIVARAKSRLSEDKYDLVFNNCEHFVAWCRSGD